MRGLAIARYLSDIVFLLHGYMWKMKIAAKVRRLAA